MPGAVFLAVKVAIYIKMKENANFAVNCLYVWAIGCIMRADKRNIKGASNVGRQFYELPGAEV
jgi:hypothetical protein